MSALFTPLPITIFNSIHCCVLKWDLLVNHLQRSGEISLDRAKSIMELGKQGYRFGIPVQNLLRGEKKNEYFEIPSQSVVAPTVFPFEGATSTLRVLIGKYENNWGLYVTQPVDVILIKNLVTQFTDCYDDDQDYDMLLYVPNDQIVFIFMLSLLENNGIRFKAVPKLHAEISEYLEDLTPLLFPRASKKSDYMRKDPKLIEDYTPLVSGRISMPNIITASDHKTGGTINRTIENNLEIKDFNTMSTHSSSHLLVNSKSMGDQYKSNDHQITNNEAMIVQKPSTTVTAITTAIVSQSTPDYHTHSTQNTTNTYNSNILQQPKKSMKRKSMAIDDSKSDHHTESDSNKQEFTTIKDLLSDGEDSQQEHDFVNQIQVSCPNTQTPIVSTENYAITSTSVAASKLSMTSDTNNINTTVTISESNNPKTHHSIVKPIMSSTTTITTTASTASTAAAGINSVKATDTKSVESVELIPEEVYLQLKAYGWIYDSGIYYISEAVKPFKANYNKDILWFTEASFQEHIRKYRECFQYLGQPLRSMGRVYSTSHIQEKSILVGVNILKHNFTTHFRRDVLYLQSLIESSTNLTQEYTGKQYGEDIMISTTSSPGKVGLNLIEVLIPGIHMFSDEHHLLTYLYRNPYLGVSYPTLESILLENYWCEVNQQRGKWKLPQSSKYNKSKDIGDISHVKKALWMNPILLYEHHFNNENSSIYGKETEFLNLLRIPSKLALRSPQEVLEDVDLDGSILSLQSMTSTGSKRKKGKGSKNTITNDYKHNPPTSMSSQNNGISSSQSNPHHHSQSSIGVNSHTVLLSEGTSRSTSTFHSPNMVSSSTTTMADDYLAYTQTSRTTPSGPYSRHSSTDLLATATNTTTNTTSSGNTTTASHTLMMMNNTHMTSTGNSGNGNIHTKTPFKPNSSAVATTTNSSIKSPYKCTLSALNISIEYQETANQTLYDLFLQFSEDFDNKLGYINSKIWDILSKRLGWITTIKTEKNINGDYITIYVTPWCTLPPYNVPTKGKVPIDVTMKLMVCNIDYFHDMDSVLYYVYKYGGTYRAQSPIIFPPNNTITTNMTTTTTVDAKVIDNSHMQENTRTKRSRSTSNSRNTGADEDNKGGGSFRGPFMKYLLEESTMKKKSEQQEADVLLRQQRRLSQGQSNRLVQNTHGNTSASTELEQDSNNMDIINDTHNTSAVSSTESNLDEESSNLDARLKRIYYNIAFGYDTNYLFPTIWKQLLTVQWKQYTCKHTKLTIYIPSWTCQVLQPLIIGVMTYVDIQGFRRNIDYFDDKDCVLRYVYYHGVYPISSEQALVSPAVTLRPVPVPSYEQTSSRRRSSIPFHEELKVLELNRIQEEEKLAKKLKREQNKLKFIKATPATSSTTLNTKPTTTAATTTTSTTSGGSISKPMSSVTTTIANTSSVNKNTTTSSNTKKKSVTTATSTKSPSPVYAYGTSTSQDMHASILDTFLKPQTGHNKKSSGTNTTNDKSIKKRGRNDKTHSNYEDTNDRDHNETVVKMNVKPITIIQPHHIAARNKLTSNALVQHTSATKSTTIQYRSPEKHMAHIDRLMYIENGSNFHESPVNILDHGGDKFTDENDIRDIQLRSKVIQQDMTQDTTIRGSSSSSSNSSRGNNGGTQCMIGRTINTAASYGMNNIDNDEYEELYDLWDSIRTTSDITEYMKSKVPSTDMDMPTTTTTTTTTNTTTSNNNNNNTSSNNDANNREEEDDSDNDSTYPYNPILCPEIIHELKQPTPSMSCIWSYLKIDRLWKEDKVYTKNTPGSTFRLHCTSPVGVEYSYYRSKYTRKMNNLIENKHYFNTKELFIHYLRYKFGLIQRHVPYSNLPMSSTATTTTTTANNTSSISARHQTNKVLGVSSSMKRSNRNPIDLNASYSTQNSTTDHTIASDHIPLSQLKYGKTNVAISSDIFLQDSTTISMIPMVTDTYNIDHNENIQPMNSNNSSNKKTPVTTADTNNKDGNAMHTNKKVKVTHDSASSTATATTATAATTTTVNKATTPATQSKVFQPPVVATLGEAIQQAKIYLRSAITIPEIQTLHLGRKKEYNQMKSLLVDNIVKMRNDVLYICGQPGQGKTMIMTEVIHGIYNHFHTNYQINTLTTNTHSKSTAIGTNVHMEIPQLYRYIFISGMNCLHSDDLYDAIGSQLGYIHDDDSKNLSHADMKAKILKQFRTPAHINLPPLSTTSTMNSASKSSTPHTTTTTSSTKKRSHKKVVPMTILVIDEIEQAPTSVIRELLNIASLNSCFGRPRNESLSVQHTNTDECTHENTEYDEDEEDDEESEDEKSIYTYKKSSLIMIGIGNNPRYPEQVQIRLHDAARITFQVYSEQDILKIVTVRSMNLFQPIAMTMLVKKAYQNWGSDIRGTLDLMMHMVEQKYITISSPDHPLHADLQGQPKPIIELKDVVSTCNQQGLGTDHETEKISLLTSLARRFIVACIVKDLDLDNPVCIRDMLDRYIEFTEDLCLNEDIITVYTVKMILNELYDKGLVTGSSTNTSSNYLNRLFRTGQYDDIYKKCYRLKVTPANVVRCPDLENRYKTKLEIYLKSKKMML